MNQTSRLAAVSAMLAATGILTAAGAVTAPPASAAAPPAWSLVASPDVKIPDNGLVAVSCPNSSHCVAVGSSGQPAGGLVPLVRSWSSRVWSVQHVPLPAGAAYPQLAAIACTSARFCLAVGQYYPRIGSQNAIRLAERWNGKSWRIVLSKGAGFLDAVSCSAYNACTAVGGTNVDTGSYESIPVAERWNGRSLAAQRVPPSLPASGIALTGIACTSARSCIAVGSNNDFGDSTAPISARWNGRRWSAVPISVPEPSGETETGFFGLSCFSATACTAPGVSADVGGDMFSAWAERWNGHRWRSQQMPGSIGQLGASGSAGIACPAAGSCLMVIGSVTLQWNEAGWAIVTSAQVPAGGDLNGISCSSASLCTAVGSITTPAGGKLTLAARWTGSTWARQPTPGNPAGGEPNGFSAVSCLAPADCVAVGTAFRGLLAASWHGTGWIVSHPAEPGGAASASLTAISCTAATCVAVGSASAADRSSTALAEQWTGSAWSLLPAPAGVGSMSAISCTTVTDCEAIGTAPSGPTANSWNGTSWTTQTLAPGPTALTAISCATASACVAVGGNGVVPRFSSAAAEYWDGTSWTLQSGLPGKDLLAVSCSAATDCTATGVDGTIDHWNGTTWSVQNPAATKAADLDGISCASASACTAVGGYESNTPFVTPLLAEHWNGTSWTLQAAPLPRPSRGNWLASVSCATATACLAVGQNYNNYDLAQTLAERYA